MNASPLLGESLQGELRPRPARDAYLSPKAARLLRLLGVRIRGDDPRLRALGTAFMETDPLADAVVDWMERVGVAQGRRTFERVLESGTADASEMPPELAALFAQLEEVPRWLDRAQLALGAILVRAPVITSGLVAVLVR
jgi:hypothetical protein